jgi:hypothetical protein
MNSNKQKKKPAAKLEQIIIPDKEKKPTATHDTIKITDDTGLNPQCNDTKDPVVNQTFLNVNKEVYNKLPQHDTQHVTNESINVVSPGAKQLKKRGRKRKIPIDPKYTNTDYIVMWPEICMGQKVLVDRYDNVYTYDLDSPLWLGVKTVYGKIDNVTYKEPLTKYYFQ